MNRLTGLIGGVFLIILPVFTMLRDFRELEVKKYGETVLVTVTKLPSDCIGGRRTKLFFHFEYQGKEHFRQIGTSFCQEHKVGQILKMKRLDKYEDIFVLPEENIFISMAAGVLLQCLGLFILVRYGVQKRIE